MFSLEASCNGGKAPRNGQLIDCMCVCVCVSVCVDFWVCERTCAVPCVCVCVIVFLCM